MKRGPKCQRCKKPAEVRWEIDGERLCADCLAARQAVDA